jgi:hypothetical protein
MKCSTFASWSLSTLLALSAPSLAGTLTVGSGSSVDLGTGSLALGCADLDVLGTLSAGGVGFTGGRDVVITPSGVLNGNSATLQLAGDWDNTGTFNAGTSSVQMVDGCGLLSAVVAGNTSFNNFAMSTASAKQVSFTAGTTQTVSGLLVAVGSLGNLLQIRSTLNGAAAFLNVQGSSSTSFVDVQDNNALAGHPIGLPSNSVKGSNTPGWLLTPVIPLLPPLAGAALGLALLALARYWLPRWRGKAVAP